MINSLRSLNVLFDKGINLSLFLFPKTLIKEFINIDVSKQFQSSDFGGELSPAQLKYCANDVIYLHKIHEELNKILIREKRVDLYSECLKFLKTRVDLDLALFKDDIWAH